MDYKMLFLSYLKRDKTSLVLTGCATAVRKAQGLLLRCEHRAALSHSAEPFQTAALFGHRNWQHSTSTSYQDSTGINLSSGWAMRFRSLAAKWLNIKVYSWKNDMGGKNGARRDINYSFLISVSARVQRLTCAAWQWDKRPADSLLSMRVQKTVPSVKCASKPPSFISFLWNRAFRQFD